MKLLETAGKTVAKVAAAVVKAVTPEPRRSRDPWYYNDARTAAAGRSRWLGQRRQGWLR